VYLLGISIFLIILVLQAVLNGSFSTLLEIKSLIIILSFTSSMLVASGLLKDLSRGFKIIVQGECTYSLIELKKTTEAIKLTIKLLLCSGFLGSIIGTVNLLSKLNDVSSIGPQLAFALFSIFYSILFTIVLLPIQAKVKSIIHTIE
jgi:flagellar motor component MotA